MRRKRLCLLQSRGFVRLILPLFVVSAWLSLCCNGSAAVFMQIDGITGEATAEGFAGWIELTSFQWGLSRSIAAPTGGSADRESSAASFSEMAVAKIADKTTPLLFGESVIGEGKTVTIRLAEARADRLDVYQEIKLENAMISAFSQSSGGDRPSESLSLNFTKITVTYTPRNNDGSAGTPVRFAYDLAAAHGQ